jgi:GMP synthase-like glutamine amidotransferase
VKPILIRQHEEMTPPGLLVDWLRERGIPFKVHPSWLGTAPDLTSYSFVASLGSPYGPNDTHETAVVEELKLIEAAVESELPVLGLCFGGEVLSAVLGGRVERARTRARLARDSDRRSGRGPGRSVARVALRALHHAARRP